MSIAAVKIGFRQEVLEIPVHQLVPLKEIALRVESTRKYKEIKASLEHIGVIEPLAVFPQTPDRYLVTNGNLRLYILRKLKVESVRCLVVFEDESYTYNKRINALSPITEHFMLLKAIANGVTPERIALGLNINVEGVRARTRLLDGVCPEAVLLLREKRVGVRTFACLRKMKPIRQIEATESNKVRITAQLIDARKDKHLWARTFEDGASDLLSLQDNVASEIAAQAKLALSPKASPAAQVDPQAQDAYLRGLYFLHRRDAVKSAAYFQQAISLAPNFAEAHAGVAQAFTLQDMQSMKPPFEDRLAEAAANARRAIELNANCGEAYTALGQIEMFYQRNWAAAQADLLRGIALNPNNPLAETEYGVYLIAMDRIGEAVLHMRRAVKLDPLSFVTNRLLGSALYFDRQYGESARSLQIAAELDPERADLTQNWLTLVYEQQGDFPRAVEADLFDMAEPYKTSMLSAYRKGGWKAYQQARIDVLSRVDKGCFAYEIGTSYLRLNDLTRALPPFHRAIDDNCFWMLWLKANPLLAPFRSDARYNELLRSVKLPQ